MKSSDWWTKTPYHLSPLFCLKHHSSVILLQTALFFYWIYQSVVTNSLAIITESSRTSVCIAAHRRLTMPPVQPVVAWGFFRSILVDKPVYWMVSLLSFPSVLWRLCPPLGHARSCSWNRWCAVLFDVHFWDSLTPPPPHPIPPCIPSIGTL